MNLTLEDSNCVGEKAKLTQLSPDGILQSRLKLSLKAGATSERQHKKTGRYDQGPCPQETLGLEFEL